MRKLVLLAITIGSMMMLSAEQPAPKVIEITGTLTMHEAGTHRNGKKKIYWKIDTHVVKIPDNAKNLKGKKVSAKGMFRRAMCVTCKPHMTRIGHMTKIFQVTEIKEKK